MKCPHLEPLPIPRTETERRFYLAGIEASARRADEFPERVQRRQVAQSIRNLKEHL